MAGVCLCWNKLSQTRPDTLRNNEMNVWIPLPELTLTHDLVNENFEPYLEPERVPYFSARS